MVPFRDPGRDGSVGRRAPFRALLPAILAFLLGSGPGLAQTVDSVVSVGVRGNVRADANLILDTFGVKVGDPYRIDAVRHGVRMVYRLGLFRDVEVEGERTDDGLAIVVVVKENPTLLRIRYDGADKLDEGDFEEVVQLVPGQTVTRRAVDRARRDIQTLYSEKGYLLAEVEPKLRGQQRADLTFHITEGKKVQIEKIRIHGNETVATDALRDVLETKEDRWWRGGDFKEEVFEEDKKRLVSRMGEAGFVDARVVGVEKTFSENRERLFLDITVEEGPVYTMGEVSLDHGGVIPEARLRRAVLLAPGEPFNTGLFEESTANLYSILHEQGYIYCNVDVRKVPREGRVIDLEYRLIEREPARINRVLIAGNTRTRDRVIRRELRVAPGDVFRRSRVIRSQREIFQLGFFNDIQLDSRTADRATGAIDLILDVEERQTGTASLGAGVNSQSGLTGFLQLSQNNFMGKGQVIGVRAEFGRFREYELSFTEPWLFGTPTSAGFSVYDTRRRYTQFTEKRRGGEVRLGRPFPWLDYTRVSTRYSFAEYRLEAEPAFEDEIGVIEPSTISSVAVSFLRNSVDSPFFPTRGSSSLLTNEIAGGALLRGDEYFHLVTFNTRSHFRTIGKFVLSLSGQVGFLNGLDGADNVPFWKRFRLGGITSNGLRGYDDYDVVPDVENAPTTGGRSMLLMTSEIRYPIAQAVQGLAFFDAGNTWKGPGQTDLTDLRRGAGLGIRIDVPMLGQLGFDYGYGFDRTVYEGGPGWEFHFQIGGRSF